MPPIVAIALALLTKEVYLSLFAGCALGALLAAEFHPWIAFDTLFNTMIDSVDFSILMFMILLGMIVMLMQESGGTRAYGEWASSHLKSKRSALVTTSLLGALIFVDDYFNCLTVGSVMRPVTDKYKVSRAKLAYIIDATAAPVCIIAPISSWAAAVNSYVPAGSSMSGFEMFVKTIPFNLYAILTLYMVFFTSIVGFDFGLMKKHEENAAKGDLFTSGEEEFQNQETKDPTEGGKYAKGKVIDLIAPMVVMIATAIAAMIWTGHLNGGQNLVEDFANCSSSERRMFKLIESVCAKRNCTTISCSVGEHQESLKLTKRATYVNNGINMVELQEIIDKTEKVEHPFTVYTLGRICYQKNPTLFNEIAELLSDVKFVWIGDGELRGELTSKNIEITGWADRTTAIKYAVNADVFLLPSRWEGLPISLLESMYMKKVCVVSNVIGNRDVIHNGENGFVCTKAEDFVKAIEACRGENEKLTEQAYRDILEMYNTKVMAEQYGKKYEMAINKRGGYSMT